jgi:plasmid stability protein
MVDVLIRDLPEDVVAAIDAQAARLGLSRNEYVRRELSQLRQRQGPALVADDLRRFADTFKDLADPEVIDQAWR